jgi:hypothetical protein
MEYRRVVGLVVLAVSVWVLYLALYNGAHVTRPAFPVAEAVPGRPHGAYDVDPLRVARAIGLLAIYSVVVTLVSGRLLVCAELRASRAVATVFALGVLYCAAINSPFFLSRLPTGQAERLGVLFRAYLPFLLDTRDGPIVVYRYLWPIAALHGLLTYGALVLAGRSRR